MITIGNLISTSKRIRILQFNYGLLPLIIHEIKSKLEEQKSDVVLIQETFLTIKNKIKFNVYLIIRKDRTIPRKLNGKIQGGGVIILIKTTNSSLKFESLSPIKTKSDNTTKIARARLHVKANNKLFSIDILNIYILPIHRGDKNDE